MSSAKQNIIESELRPDEALLWAHVISDEELPELSPRAKTFANSVFNVIWVVTLIHGLWQVSRLPAGEWLQLLTVYLPIMIIFILLQMFFNKTNMGKGLKANTTRSLFQNAIISDQRILLFNHSSSERRSFTSSDISDSRMDYENGGLALRFSPYGNEKDSLLVGAADFKTALNIIKTHFLKTGSSS